MVDAEREWAMDPEFEALNRVARYRNRLDEIREWQGLLSDTMLTISGYRMDLAPARGSDPPVMGGDAMVMVGPWSSDAEHGDDTPHPAQIVREWVERLEGPARGSWVEGWRWLRDEVPAILGSPWCAAWCEDIDGLWHRLASLTGNAPAPSEAEVQRRLVDHADELPDDALLTLAEVDAAWPGCGVSGRVRTARSRENARARRQERPPVHRLEPDARGRYRVGALREVYPDVVPPCSLHRPVGGVT